MESFEASIEVEGLKDPSEPFTGVFIRAPVRSFVTAPLEPSVDIGIQVILSLSSDNTRPPIEVIARLPSSLLPRSVDQTLADAESFDPRTVVALRQGRHLLTTFHPELTRDDRFHEYFVRSCVSQNLRAT